MAARIDVDEEELAEEAELHSTVGGRIYDVATMLLLLWPVTGGMALLGSTRVWGWSLGLMVCFLGCFLAFLRPLAMPRTSVLPRIPWSWWLFAAATLWVCIRVPYALVLGEARWDALKWVCLCLACLAWIQTGGRGERWRLLVYALLLGLSIECFYAIHGHISHSTAVWWMERAEQYGLRASGTYLCPNHLANMLAMAYCVAVVMLVTPGAGLPMRMMAVYYLALATPVLYWTQSRSGWVSLLLGLGVAAMLWGMRKGPRVFWRMAIAVPVVAAWIAVGAWFGLPAVRARVGAVIDDPRKAFSTRTEMWLDAPKMIRDRPEFGFGGGSYQWAFPPYRENANKTLTYDYMHNEYLQHVVEQGWVGFGVTAAASLFAFFALAAGAVRARNDRVSGLCMAGAGAMTAMYAHATLDFNFHIFPNPHQLILLAGLAFGAYGMREGKGGRIAGGGRKAFSAVLALLALGGMALSAMGGMGYLWTVKGDLAQEDLERQAAAEAYRNAMKWDALDWHPWLGLGKMRTAQAKTYRNLNAQVREARKMEFAEEARQAFGRSLELNPGEMEAEEGLARVEKALANEARLQGDEEKALAHEEKALEHYQKAADYQPWHRYYQEQLGIQLREMGRLDEALAVFKKNQKRHIGGPTTQANVETLGRLRYKAAKAADKAAKAKAAEEAKAAAAAKAAEEAKAADESAPATDGTEGAGE